MNLPNDTQRLAIVGRTGSGKTIAALWHLSLRNFAGMPWIIFDFKGDPTIARIKRAVQIPLSAQPPSAPGIYVVRPLPNQSEEVDDFLWKIWLRGNTGLYFDEGYMISNSEAFRAILTQGRSKHIPVIVLTQRPVWITRFVWSESDFIQLFQLSNMQDRKTMRDMMPPIPAKVQPYHSLYYDVAADRIFLLRPVPRGDSVAAGIDSQLAALARARIGMKAYG